ncbi:hypothetical protein ZWY2020_040584 [Hordeum vulgare]|nr:hypothetical protein ZWY2020_040584 [Hordeum vulgare]
MDPTQDDLDKGNDGEARRSRGGAWASSDRTMGMHGGAKAASMGSGRETDEGSRRCSDSARQRWAEAVAPTSRLEKSSDAWVLRGARLHEGSKRGRQLALRRLAMVYNGKARCG